MTNQPDPRPMKDHADDENEVHDVVTFVDGLPNVITPVIQWPAEIALAVTDALIGIVRRGHGNPISNRPDEDGITRAQTFEEGDVYMLERPFSGYHADRYLMDFYNVKDKGICSRMHLHTGLRFVRMMTGPETVIRVSSLSPFTVATVPGVHGFGLEVWEDDLPDTPEGFQRTRFNALVPPCSWVDMQIPRGTSHQFNATGPHAVIDSVHPEESIEVFREAMTDYKMMAQTMFLAEDHPDVSSCVVEPDEPVLDAGLSAAIDRGIADGSIFSQGDAPVNAVDEALRQPSPGYPEGVAAAFDSTRCLSCGADETVRHDPDCPVYQRRRAQGLER